MEKTPSRSWGKVQDTPNQWAMGDVCASADANALTHIMLELADSPPQRAKKMRLWELRVETMPVIDLGDDV